MNYICELYVTCDMYDLGCMLMVLDGLPGLYGLKYDRATTYGLSLYLCSYKLVGSATEMA